MAEWATASNVGDRNANCLTSTWSAKLDGFSLSQAQEAIARYERVLDGLV